MLSKMIFNTSVFNIFRKILKKMTMVTNIEQILPARTRNNTVVSIHRQIPAKLTL